jgi:hypothetical protein
MASASVQLDRALALDAEGDSLRFGQRRQPLEDERMHRRPPGQHRAATQPVLADLLLLDPGRVCREGDVHHQPHLRVHSEGAGPGAAPLAPDLLLGGGHRHRAGSGGVPLGEMAERGQHDVRPDPVVDRAGGDEAASQLHQGRIDHRRVAYPHPAGQRVLAVLRPDIHPQVGELDRLLPLLRADEVDGAPAHDPDAVAIARQDPESLADQHLRVPPADPVEVEKAVVVDVRHHHPDLVDVAGEHHGGATAPRHLGRDASLHVGADVLHAGDGGGLFAPHTAGAHLEAGGSGGVEKGAQEGADRRALALAHGDVIG